MKFTPLTIREKYCVLIASCMTVGKRRSAKFFLKKSIQDDRLPERMLSELLLHLALLLGFPTMLDGFSTLRRFVQHSSIVKNKDLGVRMAGVKGRRVLKRIYGKSLPRLLANLEVLHADIPALIVRDVYGKMISRPGLSLKEREITNVAVLSIQGLDEQLFSHLRGASRIGVHARTLASVITLAAKTSGVRNANAARVLADFSNRL